MNRTRPVNLALTTIRFPLTAIVSILHRISGIVLFLMIPLALLALSVSLSSAEGFHQMQAMFMQSWVKLLAWAGVSAFLYHVTAGVRHLLMDIGFGENLASARIGSRIVMVIAIVLILGAGVYLW